MWVLWQGWTSILACANGAGVLTWHIWYVGDFTLTLPTLPVSPYKIANEMGERFFAYHNLKALNSMSLQEYDELSNFRPNNRFHAYPQIDYIFVFSNVSMFGLLCLSPPRCSRIWALWAPILEEPRGYDAVSMAPVRSC